MISDDESEEATPAPKQSRAITAAADIAEGDDQGFSTVGAGGRTLRYTAESILSSLRAFQESRGRKNGQSALNTENICIVANSAA